MRQLLLKMGLVAALSLGAAGTALAQAGEGSQDADTSKESRTSDAAAAAAATSTPLEDRIKAVQQKRFLKRLRVELFPWAGATLNDAFYQYFHTGAAATFHVMEGLAVEAGASVAPVRVELPSVILLRQNKSAVPQAPRYFGNVNANLQLSPIYGKMSLMSEWIVHYDMFVLGGGGLAFDSSDILVHPEITVGVGQRLFVMDWMVLRADLRGSLYPQLQNKLTMPISNLQNQITALVGVGFYIPPSFSYETVVGTKRK